jgi:proteasome lid subunit RPN8/RPN11
MKQIRATISEALWTQLCAALDQREETAGILFAGIADGDRTLTLCLNDIRWVPVDAYELREARMLRITSEGWMPALGKAAAEGWQPIFFHTHPNNDPDPSSADREVQSQLERDVRIRVDRPYASIILGGTPEKPQFTGLMDRAPIERIQVVGDRLQFLAAHGVIGGAIDPPNAFDRQIRAFGREGQRLLRSLRFGIVGVGGTGSAVFEQLVRLGAGEIVVIDDDHVTETNPTRIHESGMNDVGDLKVDVLSRAADRIGLGTEISSINAKVTSRTALEALRGCDAVFGCTDDNAGRGILSRFAYHYLTPVFDVGVLVGSRNSEISAIEARLTTMVPGAPCLFCRGRIDANRLREEMQSEDEVADLVQEGYAQGLGERDPAVVAYTTMIASMAVDELLQRLFGYGPDNPSTEVLIKIPPREIRHLGGKPIAGHFCADPDVLGRADQEPPLGMAWL